MIRSSRIVFLIILFYIGTSTSHLLSSNSSTTEWTVNLGTQYPGVTPLFVRAGNDIAIASIIQTYDKVVEALRFQLNVRMYTRDTGVQKKCCQVQVGWVSEKIWDTRMVAVNESSVIVSWLYSRRSTATGGIRLVAVDTRNCFVHDLEVVLYKDFDIVFFLPYAVLPYDNGDYDVFVRSPEFCEAGVCRIHIVADDQRITQIGKVPPFVQDDDSLIWNIIPVKAGDSSQGFYYIELPDPIAQSDNKAKITRLSNNGTILDTVEVGAKVGDEVAHSTAYGNLGFCYTNAGGIHHNSTTSHVINCLLFDSTLSERKIEVAIPTCTGNCSAYSLPVKKIAMANIRNGGFVLLVNSCFDKNCVSHVTLARTIMADGRVAEEGALEVSKSRDGCFPRKNYDAFVFEDEDVYCFGMPCMSKLNVDDKLYDVSLSTKCFRNP